MKKQATILTIVTFTMLLSETDLSSDLLFFVLIGAIPGTNYSLSSTTMLTLIGLIATVAIFSLGRSYRLHLMIARLSSKAYHIAKDQLAKHPLGQV